MRKVEVRVRCVAGMGGSDMRMLVMETVDGKTVFPVITGEHEACYLHRQWDDDVRRPMPYDLIESLMNGFGVRMQEACIYRLFEGVFYTRIMFSSETGSLETESRVSDAVILASRNRCPVYVDEEVLKRVGIPSRMLGPSVSADSVKAVDVNDPLDGLSPEKLERLLEEAVECENFELASLLRDKIKSLEKN